MDEREQKTWAMAAHAAGPVGMLISAGLAGFLAPLIIWLVKRDESEFIADQAKEALNFQITLFLLYAASVVLLVVTLGIGILIVIPLWIVMWIGALVLGIVAAMQSYDGVRYRYPLTLRLIS